MQLIKMMSKLIQVLTESPEQSQNICTKYLGTFFQFVSHVLLYGLEFHSFRLNFVSIYNLNLRREKNSSDKHFICCFIVFVTEFFATEAAILDEVTFECCSRNIVTS